MFRRSYCVLLLSTLLAGVVVGHTTTAFSLYQRQHGSFCSVAQGSPSNFVDRANISSAGFIVLGCSMPDSHIYPKESAHVGVFVRDGHPSESIVAARCTEFSFSEGGDCGAAVFTVGTGTQGLNPPSTDNLYWQDADGNEVPYVQVTLPRMSGSSKSIIKGTTGVY